MLHVDIWWKGNNVAIDPGTFSYGDGGTACQQLVRAGAHNTVEVDGQDQMEQFSKFLWFPWPTGRVLRYASSNSKRLTYWEGEHDGYARIGVRHRRAIISLDRARWIIIDRLEARKEHIYRLNWHFSDVPYLWDPKRRCLSLDYANGQFAVQISSHGEISDAGVRRAASDGTGWRSRYYYTREPSLLLSAAVDAKNETFASFFGPAPASIQWQSGVIEATGDAWRASIEVGWDPGASIASHIRLLGESADELGVH
jgi:asparagine synthase (glutamine-hydrolysing)